MTVCPIAIAVGCKKCPAFGICPLKSVLGDQGGGSSPPSGTDAKPKTPQQSRK